MLKEHHIPMFLREADENMFSVIMRARIMSYAYFLILAGCMPSLSLYFVDASCLFTAQEATETKTTLDVSMTDYYQVCLIMFVWFISVPMVLFVILAKFKDASRYLLVPIVVASLVFVLVCSLLALLVIGFTIVHGNSLFMRVLTAINCTILVFSIAINKFYTIRYSKKDLLQSDEQQIDA